jgi:hypothetical protein
MAHGEPLPIPPSVDPALARAPPPPSSPSEPGQDSRSHQPRHLPHSICSRLAAPSPTTPRSHHQPPPLRGPRDGVRPRLAIRRVLLRRRRRCPQGLFAPALARRHPLPRPRPPAPRRPQGTSCCCCLRVGLVPFRGGFMCYWYQTVCLSPFPKHRFLFVSRRVCVWARTDLFIC